MNKESQRKRGVITPSHMVSFNLASTIENAIKEEKTKSKKGRFPSNSSTERKTTLSATTVIKPKPVLFTTATKSSSSTQTNDSNEPLGHEQCSKQNSNGLSIKEQQEKKKSNRKKTVLKKRIEKVVEDKPLDNFSCIKIDDIFIDENNKDLREEIVTYLKSTVAFSQNLYSRDVEKAKQHRFIITGLHETLHYVKYNKAQFVCIAEDIIEMKNTKEIVDSIVRFCKENSIPIVQCCKKRKIARIFKRGQAMSCICIVKDSFTLTKEFKALEVALCTSSTQN